MQVFSILLIQQVLLYVVHLKKESKPFQIYIRESSEHLLKQDLGFLMLCRSFEGHVGPKKKNNNLKIEHPVWKKSVLADRPGPIVLYHKIFSGLEGNGLLLKVFDIFSLKRMYSVNRLWFFGSVNIGTSKAF